VIGMTKSVALDFVKQGIRCTAPARLTTIHRAELVQSLVDCEQEVCRVHERAAEG
jgi:hypothetical protein